MLYIFFGIILLALLIIWNVDVLRGWRTTITTAILAIQPGLVVMQQFAMLPEFSAVIPPQWLPWYALAMSGATFWMRKLTTTPLGQPD